MSQLYVDGVKDRAGTGGPTLGTGVTVTGSGGINASGVVTATTFSGNLTGNATGLSGTPSVTVNLLTATDANVGGALTVGGVLTYEDVTNVDSIGLVTARTGVRVTAGGLVVTAGVSTFSAPVNINSSPNFSEGLNVSAGVATFAGNQTVAGTATFAKKTTVNATLDATEGLHVSAGVVTAAGEFRVGSAVTIGSAGVTTFHAGANFSQGGILREKVYINATAFNQSTASTLEVNLDEGMVHYRSTAIDSASTVPNIMSNVGVNTVMAVGDILNVTIITEADNTSYFINAITIDGQAVTEDWVGGSAPSDGGGSATDTYSFNILKIGSSGTYNNDYVVVANHVKTS